MGERIAAHRRRARISGEELAARAGEGLTRSMGANLENGRKLDLSVRQLVAVAAVLGVSPADLVFDLRDPYAPVELTSGTEPRVSTAHWLAYGWFGGSRTLREVADTSEAAAHNQVAALDSWLIHDLLRERDATHYALAAHERFLDEYKRDPESVTSSLRGTDPEEARRKVRDWRAELYDVERKLRAYGVNIDRPIVYPSI